MKAWPILVSFYEGRREFDKALDALSQFMEAFGPNPVLRLYHADLLVRAGDYEAAESAVEAIETPELKAIARGRLLLATGQPALALESLEEGIRHWPNNGVARQLAAEAAERLGDYERALSEYKESVRADANNFEALSRLAQLHEATGQPDELIHLVIGTRTHRPNDARNNFSPLGFTVRLSRKD